jgi:hypothetical protein
LRLRLKAATAFLRAAANSRFFLFSAAVADATTLRFAAVFFLTKDANFASPVALRFFTTLRFGALRFLVAIVFKDLFMFTLLLF